MLRAWGKWNEEMQELKKLIFDVLADSKPPSDGSQRAKRNNLEFAGIKREDEKIDKIYVDKIAERIERKFKIIVQKVEWKIEKCLAWKLKVDIKPEKVAKQT